MKPSRRDRLEKVLRRYNIYLWQPGISTSPNCYVGGTFFVEPLVLCDLIQAHRGGKKKK